MTTREEIVRALRLLEQEVRRIKAGWWPVEGTCRYCGLEGRLCARRRTSAGGHRDREVRCLMCHHSWIEETNT